MYNLQNIFQKYKEYPIAIYGLGTETERVLSEIGSDFHIIGLLDGFREDGVIYGKPIVSLEHVAESQVKLIIVVARPGSCRAIMKRIGKFCTENHIDLFDVRGKDLLVQNEAAYDLKHVKGFTKGQLLDETSEHEIISFDLFDTLIMRQTLLATDVIGLTECRLKEKGIFLEDFCNKRLQAEKELSNDTAPTLKEIYQLVLDQYEPIQITAEEVAEIEWMIEYSLVIPRQEMVDIMSELCKNGKKIYIVTDTYYRKEQIIKLLDKCEIKSYTDVFVSCEYRTGKKQGLFSELNKKIGGQKCLHIGDDLIADIESAGKFGISSFQIYSSLDLLEMVGYFGLWDKLEELSARIKVGMFVAKIFNSPFQFETESRKINIKDAYDLGYLFLAPVISDFVIWFAMQMRENSISNIWLGMRDGYLIKKMYDILSPNNDAICFLTSRMAAIRAAMVDMGDIEYVADMKFSGTIEQQLKERFGIIVREEEVEERKSLQDYSNIIFDKSTINKRNYQAYINSLDLKKGDIAFFDFVAKGTTQMYLSRLVENHMKGFYFLQLEREFMKDKGLDIQAFYGDDESRNCAIYEDYYVLETILTSPMPSVTGFDENGDVCYAEEIRTEEDIECFLRVQDGIMDYFRNYIKLCPQPEKGIDKELDGSLLRFIHKFVILDKGFMNLKVEDAFFNRLTDISDLV
ncbi:MAG: HAD hydrolase-like protein [Lachnospiraceae bacterium]|nr:HAD hydrolase-like protein [Lachnospiraceae bacterium]